MRAAFSSPPPGRPWKLPPCGGPRPPPLFSPGRPPVPPALSLQRLSANQVAVTFGTVSNWTSILQRADELGSNANAMAWSNLMTVPPALTNGQAVYVDAVTNRQSLYRVILSP